MNIESDEDHHSEPDVHVSEIPSFNITKTNYNEVTKEENAFKSLKQQNSGKKEPTIVINENQKKKLLTKNVMQSDLLL